MTDLTQYICVNKKTQQFAVDLEDSLTGECTCYIGDTITFTYEGQQKQGIVTDQLIGRDGNVALLNIIQ